MKRRSHDKNTKHGNFLNHRHKRYKRLQMQTSESSEERNSVIQEFCHLTVPVTEQLKILYKAANHQENNFTVHPLVDRYASPNDRCCATLPSQNTIPQH